MLNVSDCPYGARQPQAAASPPRAGVKFNHLENAKNQFNIDRTAFRAGDVYDKQHVGSIANINKRTGLGNREIIRPSFMSPVVRPRLAVDFNKLEEEDIGKYGQKVQLGKEQLAVLTMVAVPDPQDVSWLTEKARMVRNLRNAGMNDNEIERELEVNKPLGREQRVLSKPSKNIAREQGLSFQDKLAEIKQEIDNGNANSRVQMATLVGQIAVVLQNQNVVARMTEAELRNVNTSLMRLKVPKDYRAVFGGRRVIAGTGQYFAENKGIIAMFLMSNIPADRTPNQPLMSWHLGRNRYEPAALLKIYQMGNDRFLDMETRTIDSVASLAAKGLQPPAIVAAPVLGMPGSPDFDLFA